MKIRFLLALALLIMATSLWAELKPQDMIKYRQSAYTLMRWNMGIIKQQVKNPNAFDRVKTQAAANVIVSIAESELENLFDGQTKQGKGWVPTKAKPEFFQQSEEVKKLFSDFRQQAQDLAAISKSGDPARIKPQFEKLFQSCKNCHKKFRQKKK